jgi:hypothetical protein
VNPKKIALQIFSGLFQTAIMDERRAIFQLSCAVHGTCPVVLSFNLKTFKYC